jgi:hypothetical protein
LRLGESSGGATEATEIEVFYRRIGIIESSD